MTTRLSIETDLAESARYDPVHDCYVVPRRTFEAFLDGWWLRRRKEMQDTGEYAVPLVEETIQ